MNSMSVLTEQELEHLVELDAVVHEEAAGGATPVIVGVIAITLSAGICPTSACTKEC
ncbi:class II lanthipeptide, LchA2/BrtA2 family [Rothia dentocariosa]